MFSGATHIVHHYVPGQPFYIREVCYRQVKDLMVANGVRLNDFGIVARGNLYYDVPAKGVSPAAEKEGAVESRTISPNNSNMLSMVLWLTLCFTLGASSYVLFDQWTAACLGTRIFRKYISKKKAE